MTDSKVRSDGRIMFYALEIVLDKLMSTCDRRTRPCVHVSEANTTVTKAAD